MKVYHYKTPRSAQRRAKAAGTLFDPATRYEVRTWESDEKEFTPQIGVRRGPYTLFGLRKAIRQLQGMGYGKGRHSMLSVLVERYWLKKS